MTSETEINKARTKMERAQAKYEEAQAIYDREEAVRKSIQAQVEEKENQLRDIKREIGERQKAIGQLKVEFDRQLRDVKQRALYEMNAIVMRAGNAKYELENIPSEAASLHADEVIADAKDYNPDANELFQKLDEYRETKRKTEAAIVELEQKQQQLRDELVERREAFADQGNLVQEKSGILDRLKKAFERLLKEFNDLMHPRPEPQPLPSEPPLTEPWHPLTEEERIMEYGELCKRIGVTPTARTGTTAERLAQAKAEMVNAVKQKTEIGLSYCTTRPERAIADHTKNAYNPLLDAYAGGNYEQTLAAYDTYLGAIGMADEVKQALKQAYTPKKFNNCPPPMVVLYENGMRVGRKGAFHCDNVIYLDKRPGEWNGHPTTATHEAGHAWDMMALRGQDYDRSTADTDINRAVKQIQERFSRRNATITLFGETYTKREWKANFVSVRDGGETHKAITSEFGAKLKRSIAQRTGLDVHSFTVKKLSSQITDAFQNILGFEYGAGHHSRYCRDWAGTGIEAVAQIHSQVSMGIDILREPFPELYDLLYGRMKG